VRVQKLPHVACSSTATSVAVSMHTLLLVLELVVRFGHNQQHLLVSFIGGMKATASLLALSCDSLCVNTTLVHSSAFLWRLHVSLSVIGASGSEHAVLLPAVDAASGRRFCWQLNSLQHAMHTSLKCALRSCEPARDAAVLLLAVDGLHDAAVAACAAHCQASCVLQCHVNMCMITCHM
jgi:hypothetical protein